MTINLKIANLLRHATRYVSVEGKLGLKDDRRLIFEVRSSCEIIVKKHAFEDYPERGFSEREIIDLVRNGTGRMVNNNSPDAISGSYFFFLKTISDVNVNW